MRLIDRASPAPFMDGVIGKIGGLLSETWQFWIERVTASLHAVPSVLNTIVLDEQEADIPATDIAEMVLPEGVYRVSYFIHIHRPASANSSLVVTIAWTDNDGAHTMVGDTIVGNSLVTSQTGTTVLYSAKAQPVTYEIAYNSVGAVTMQYTFIVFIEQIRQ